MPTEPDKLLERINALQPREGPPQLDRARVFGEEAPRAANNNRWWGLGVLLAAAVALLVIVPDWSSDLGWRGAGVRVVEVTLSLYLQGEQTERLPRDATVAVGDRVIFEVTAEEEAPVRVWAVEAGQETALGVVEAGPGPHMLTSPNGLMAWAFEQPGTVTFYAASTESGCEPDTCDSWAVTVR